MKFGLKLIFISILFYSFISSGSSDTKDDLVQEQLLVSTLNTFSSNQESQSIKVTANIDWVTDNNLDWVTVSPNFGTNNGTILITVASNPNLTLRSGNITVIWW